MRSSGAIGKQVLGYGTQRLGSRDSRVKMDWRGNRERQSDCDPGGNDCRRLSVAIMLEKNNKKKQADGVGLKEANENMIQVQTGRVRTITNLLNSI